jgi:hypothetical protein
MWILSNANGLGGTPSWTGPITTIGGPPSMREQHTAVYDAAEDTMIVFGGFSSLPTPRNQNNVWLLANADSLTGTSGWNRVAASGPFPPSRSGAVAGFDEANKILMVYGGSGLIAGNTQIDPRFPTRGA